jgi:hypothetical protein
MAVEPEPPELEVLVTSLLSHRTRQGIVSLKVGEFETQMPPAKARQIAGFLFEAAEAADSDALFWAWSTGTLGFDEEVAIQGLRSFRALRDAKRKKEEEDAVG